MQLKPVLAFIAGLLLCVPICAQSLPDASFNYDYAAEVKSLDEFRARFNGEESKPDVEEAEGSRRNNLLSLFDFQMEQGGLTREEFGDRLNAFVDTVMSGNIQFGITDCGLFAECLCRMTYAGKERHVTLYLRSERMPGDRYRWAIAGVKGLPEAGIIDTDRYYTISPVEHEVHFMGLSDMLNENPSQAFGYRSKESVIDQLSVFLTLVHSGLLKFELVERETFLYFDIPGFVIRIDEITRRGDNSGWLITSLEEVSDEEKEVRINNIYGYE